MITSTPAKVRKINDYGQASRIFPLPAKNFNRQKMPPEKEQPFRLPLPYSRHALSRSPQAGTKTRKSPNLRRSETFKPSVELEGVEPSSKQGSHMLSTCLSLPSVFVRRQDQSHQPAP